MRANVLALLLLVHAAGAAAQALPGRTGQPTLNEPRRLDGPTLSPAALVSSITVTPDSAVVDAGACQQFTAQASGPTGTVENVAFTFAIANASAFQGDGNGAVCAMAGLPESARTTVTVAVPGSQVTATATLVARPAYQHPATRFRQKGYGETINTSAPTGPTGTATSPIPNFAGVSIRPLEARLSWTPFVNATGYTVMRDGQIISGYQPIRGSTYVDTGVAPGQHGYSVLASLTLQDGRQVITAPSSLTTILVDVLNYPPHQVAWLARPNGPGSQQESQRYYQAIGAIPDKDTFDKWKQRNLFDAAPLNHAELRSVYFNSVDLEFGRDMHCVEHKRDRFGTIGLYPRANNLGLAEGEVIVGAACWVANHGPEPGTTGFPNPTKALAEAGEGKNPFAIVAMEWKAGAGVKFYAFGRDGRLVTAAALDSEGPKFVPNACLACHGGLFDSEAGQVHGAAFLPFDMSTFRLRPDDPRGGYLPYDFAKLNALVANTREGRDAITEFIDGLNREGDHYVPASWAGKEDVYRQVIKPYCRTCHLAVRPDVIASAQQFQAQAPRVQAVLCSIGSMPHAEVPFKKFWASTNPYAPALLKTMVNLSCGS
jgi:hypothetical protein